MRAASPCCAGRVYLYARFDSNHPPLTTTTQPLQQQQHTHGTRQAVVLLAFCCLLWGFSFPTAQRAAAIMEQAAPKTLTELNLSVMVSALFNGWRFLASMVVYALLTWRSQRDFTAVEVRGGVIIGCLICGGVFLQLLGLRYTVPSVSAFLTALAIVFAPLAQSLLLRRKVGKAIWSAVAVALCGSVVLSWPGDFAAQPLLREGPIPFTGELLTIISALFFTAHILTLDHFGRRANTSRLTLVMCATAGIVSTTVGVAVGGVWFLSAAGLALFANVQFTLIFASLVLLSGILALHLMNRYQPLIAPAAATVIYCLEPVFATIFSGAFGAETITPTTLLGGTIVLSAVLLVARSER